MSEIDGVGVRVDLFKVFHRNALIFMITIAFLYLAFGRGRNLPPLQVIADIVIFGVVYGGIQVVFALVRNSHHVRRKKPDSASNKEKMDESD